MIISHLTCANFFMINLNVLKTYCYNFWTITEKPWQNMLVSGKLPPKKIASRSGSEFGLRVALELGLGDNFPRGQFPLEY